MIRKPQHPELTTELVHEICTSVSAGMLPPAAAALAGVDRGQFSEWMRRAQKGEEPFLNLSREIDKTALTAQRRIVASVSLAATRDPKIAMLYLSLRFPEDWSERDGKRSVRIEVGGRSAGEIETMTTRIRARVPLLPWEEGPAFEEMVSGLLREYEPRGPTEEHLVEELAGVLLRKGRLRQAEIASHRSALKRATASHSGTVEAAVAHLSDEKPGETILTALTATDEETAEELAEAEADEAQIEKVVAILESKKADRYAIALKALGDKKEWWDEELASCRDDEKIDRTAYVADPGEDDDEIEDLDLGRSERRRREASVPGLLKYLSGEVLPWYEKHVFGLKSRPLIRQQALGEAFDGDDVERFSRIEASLDRKMEKTLDRLLQLQGAGGPGRGDRYAGAKLSTVFRRVSAPLVAAR